MGDPGHGIAATRVVHHRANLGSPRPTDFGKDLLKALAQEIGKLPNRVTMEGHTDSKPYKGVLEYSNWELSADRANGARRIMQHNGLRGDQVSSIRGYADQRLRNKADAKDPSNRRISVIVQYVGSDTGTLKPPAGDGKAEHKAD